MDIMLIEFLLQRMKSSLNIRVIANRNVIIAPKDSLEDFEIYVDFDIWNIFDDISLRDYKVLFYNEVTGYHHLMSLEEELMNIMIWEFLQYLLGQPK